MIPDIPPAARFELEISVIRPVDSPPAETPSTPTSWLVTLTLATPVVYRGTLVVPPEALAGSSGARRVAVEWTSPPLLPVNCPDAVPRAKKNPKTNYPGNGVCSRPGAEIANLKMECTSGPLTTPIGFLGMRFVWWY